MYRKRIPKAVLASILSSSFFFTLQSNLLTVSNAEKMPKLIDQKETKTYYLSNISLENYTSKGKPTVDINEDKISIQGDDSAFIEYSIPLEKDKSYALSARLNKNAWINVKDKNNNNLYNGNSSDFNISIAGVDSINIILFASEEVSEYQLSLDTLAAGNTEFNLKVDEMKEEVVEEKGFIKKILESITGLFKKEEVNNEPVISVNTITSSDATENFNLGNYTLFGEPQISTSNNFITLNGTNEEYVKYNVLLDNTKEYKLFLKSNQYGVAVVTDSKGNELYNGSHENVNLLIKEQSSIYIYLHASDKTSNYEMSLSGYSLNTNIDNKKNDSIFNINNFSISSNPKVEINKNSKLTIYGEDSYIEYFVPLNENEDYLLSGLNSNDSYIEVEGDKGEEIYSGEGSSIDLTISTEKFIKIRCYGAKKGASYRLQFNSLTKLYENGESSYSGIQVGYEKLTEENYTHKELSEIGKIVSTSSGLASAINNAKAGDIIYVREGNYNLSQLSISCKGKANNYITIKNYPGETPNIKGTKILFTSSAKYINFEGFKISDLTNAGGMCIRFDGGCSNINFRNNIITNIKASSSAKGTIILAIFGNSDTTVQNVNIENNHFYDCNSGESEVVMLNGNIEDCSIIENTIDNCGSVGIDIAGNYKWTGTAGDANNQSRYIKVSRNVVKNCKPSNNSLSAGIYCDGSSDVTISHNIVYKNKMGIVLEAEESGVNIENFHINNNLIIDNGKSLTVGSTLDIESKHKNTYIYNNTIVCGNSYKENYGLKIEKTTNIRFFNNIVYGTKDTILYDNKNGSAVYRGNNLYYQPGGTLPSSETSSIFADPLFINNTGDLKGNYALKSDSPAIDQGKKKERYTGEMDLSGKERTKNTIDIGCYEN